MRRRNTTKKNKMRKNKTHKNKKSQRLWKQKGCSRYTINRRKNMKGGCGCNLQTGGMGMSMSNIPPPLIGSPYNINENAGQSNYYENNTEQNGNLQTMGIISERNNGIYPPIFKGGKKRKFKGGGLIPQDLVNLGRIGTYGLGSAYNSVRGYDIPTNPLPYEQELIMHSNKF